MALQRDTKKFVAGDITEVAFPRRKVMGHDAEGHPTGRVMKTTLQLTVALRNTAGELTGETYEHNVSEDVSIDESAMLSAAVATLSGAERTAVLDALWEAFKSEHKLIEV
jgi:hypothetical protein